MRKAMIVFGVVLVVAAVWTVSAYAADGESVNAWQGFWNSVGGFLYNALPWNWGGWMGKSA